MSNTPSTLPLVVSPTKMAEALCNVIFEELEGVFLVADSGVHEFNTLQRQLLERYRATTLQFAHDMLLASGNHMEIARRLNVEPHPAIAARNTPE